MTLSIKREKVCAVCPYLLFFFLVLQGFSIVKVRLKGSRQNGKDKTTSQSVFFGILKMRSNWGRGQCRMLVGCNWETGEPRGKYQKSLHCPLCFSNCSYGGTPVPYLAAHEQS